MTGVILKKLSEHRTFIFLIMCLGVHVFNVFLFLKFGILPLVVLNAVSSCLYVLFLVVFKRNSDLQIIFAYFEIIAFSLCSELISGGHFGYVYYVIGMVAVVFFLLPSQNGKKHIYQFLGATLAVGISQISVYNFSLYPELIDVVLDHKAFVNSLNLVITLFTLFYVSNLYLIELKAAREKLDYTSNHDMLTGLYNRRFFENVMKRSKEEKERAFSVAMIDVDDFKKANDTYGHEAGDKVLENVSECVNACLPSNGIAVRWGGEEFVLYLPQMNKEGALEILEGFRGKLQASPVVYKGQTISITVTIGLCSGCNILDYENYLREADEKLYWGKTHGKNQIVTEMS